LCHVGGFFAWKRLSASFGYGSVGVDLFFVLSGLLMNGILIDARDDRNRTMDFYIWRGLRIFAALLCLPDDCGDRLSSNDAGAASLLAFVLFIQNFLISKGPDRSYSQRGLWQ
jgi:hypothetical protein